MRGFITALTSTILITDMNLNKSETPALASVLPNFISDAFYSRVLLYARKVIWVLSSKGLSNSLLPLWISDEYDLE